MDPPQVVLGEDIGTTAHRVARHLHGRALTVITSKLAVYEELQDGRAVQLILPAGVVRPSRTVSPSNGDGGGLYDAPRAVLRPAGGVRLRQVRLPREEVPVRRPAGDVRPSTQLAIIPQYEIMVRLGWLGTLKALIAPAAANAFGIFRMRQYTGSGVPDELLDTARTEGVGLPPPVPARGTAVRPPGPGVPRHPHLHRRLERLHPAVGDVGRPRPAHPPGRAGTVVRRTLHRVGIVVAGVLLSVVPLVTVFAFFARGFIADATKGALR
ncbi:hypothetical protein ABZT03_14245 [Streptomyces sp. NPDC005574]|uniref:hypothetical protein n=1 Tax=Streptomyces sp. NPDC005574 TaxID=3156891 RepID=UPI0033A708D4